MKDFFGLSFKKDEFGGISMWFEDSEKAVSMSFNDNFGGEINLSTNEGFNSKTELKKNGLEKKYFSNEKEYKNE